MEKIETEKCNFDDTEICYHLSRKTHKKEIEDKGLISRLGVRSTGHMGKEKTPKVFFSKSMEGTLMFLNRTLNIFKSAIEWELEIKNVGLDRIRQAFKDDDLEEYEQMFKEGIHRKMTEQEIDDLALKLGKRYFERGIYYKCDLEGTTKSEYENLPQEEKANIDYLVDDINEENGKTHRINNMHTIIGKGIPKEKLSLLTSNGSESALDVIMDMCNYYKKTHPNEKLPILKDSDDKHLLDIIFEKEIEKKNGNSLDHNISSNIINVTKKNNVKARDVVQGQSELKSNYKEIENPTQDKDSKDVDINE